MTFIEKLVRDGLLELDFQKFLTLTADVRVELAKKLLENTSWQVTPR